MQRRLGTIVIPGLLLAMCGCAQVLDAEQEASRRIWVPYTHRGVLHRVRADGSDRAQLREKLRRGAPASEPDVKLFDLWSDPAPRPGAETIAVIRERNQSFNVHPAAPADFDQSWDLVLVDPRAGAKMDRIVHTSREELSRPRWSTDGKQILAQVGRRQLLVWNETSCSVHTLTFPATEPEMPRLLLAGFGNNDGTVDVIMDSYLKNPYLLGSARLREGDLQVTPLHRFKRHLVPDAIRQIEPVNRLFGEGGRASVLGPPLLVTADGRFSFFYRKKEGFLPRGWIEGHDSGTGATFEVTTLWRGLYAE